MAAMTADEGERRDAVLSLRLLWGAGGRRSRGPKPGLSVERIVRAAIEVADADGLAALSMRRVADQLGVGTMSLYRYVPGKDELLDLMQDLVIADTVDPAQEPFGWRARLEAMARGEWALFHRHPWMLLITQRHPVMGPNEARAFESLLRALSTLGLTESEMVGVVTLVDGYVRGTARYTVDAIEAERRTGISTEQWWAAQGEALGEVLGAGEFPMMTRVAEAGVWGQAEDVGFEFGLQRVLDGLEVFITARATG
jgi:AcrR family transcriptional regulator